VPGKTQTINYYRIAVKIGEQERKEFFLVDLPGYGYAKAARTAKRQWSAFIEQYLTKSSRLKMVCQLIDARHPPMDSDITMTSWLGMLSMPVRVVVTKMDKLSRMQAQKQLKIIRDGLGISSEIPYSSVTGLGRDELLNIIAAVLAGSNCGTDGGEEII
jgi:GTP-binding protein